ncbi:MAG: TVP38/TMEM64 family protein [Syntrophobacteraceae bacterium]
MPKKAGEECDSMDQELGKTQAEIPNQSSGKNGVWLRFAFFLGGFCLFLFVLYQTGWIKVFFNKEEAATFLESLGPIKFLGFILLQITQVVFAPIPGEATGILGGYFFGVLWGIILSTIGLTIGSLLAFSLSRTFGRPLVEKLVDKAVMNRFDYLLQHKGIFLVFMLFLLPGFPKDYLCFILGLGHLTTLQFLAVSTIGRVFGTVLLTISGGYIRCEEYGKLLVLIGIAIAVTVTAYLFRRRIEAFLHSLHCKNQ